MDGDQVGFVNCRGGAVGAPSDESASDHSYDQCFASQTLRHKSPMHPSKRAPLNRGSNGYAYNEATTCAYPPTKMMLRIPGFD
jgi:hypothetical protein